MSYSENYSLIYFVMLLSDPVKKRVTKILSSEAATFIPLFKEKPWENHTPTIQKAHTGFEPGTGGRKILSRSAESG